MPVNLNDIKARTTPVGKILGVIEYLEGMDGSTPERVLQTAAETKVAAVSGLNATDVQAAIAELTLRVAALEKGGTS